MAPGCGARVAFRHLGIERRGTETDGARRRKRQQVTLLPFVRMRYGRIRTTSPTPGSEAKRDT